MDRFALRIENTLLEGDVDVGCHKTMIIRDGENGPDGSDGRSDTVTLRTA
jgi:hypothetical protein